MMKKCKFEWPSLINKIFFQTGEFICNACSKGKLITQSSPIEIGNELTIFLERIHDIYGTIHLQC